MPSLIVLDTFSRSLVGADENGQRDMTKVVDSIDRVRKETGATILLIHHTRKAGDMERGSTVLRGAADLMIAVKAGESGITLHADKVNDFTPFGDLKVRLEAVGDSCVLSKCQEADSEDRDRGHATRLSPKAKHALRVLSAHPNGLTITAWGRVSGMPTATLGRLAKDRLAAGGLVRLGDGGKQYLVTDAGHAALI